MLYTYACISSHSAVFASLWFITIPTANSRSVMRPSVHSDKCANPSPFHSPHQSHIHIHTVLRSLRRFSSKPARTPLLCVVVDTSLPDPFHGRHCLLFSRQIHQPKNSYYLHSAKHSRKRPTSERSVPSRETIAERFLMLPVVFFYVETTDRQRERVMQMRQFQSRCSFVCQAVLRRRSCRCMSPTWRRRRRRCFVLDISRRVVSCPNCAHETQTKTLRNP